MASPFVSMCLWRYTSFSAKWWAFTQMGIAPFQLAKTDGLRFGRLMGSGGGNGFSIKPNFGVYAQLGVWEDKSAAEAFFASHPWALQAKKRSIEQMCFWLKPIQSHGKWAGQYPFGEVEKPEHYDSKLPMAVITRATIRTNKLPDFWRYVPKTSASVYQHPDRLFSIGIGEYPIFMQATFSIWSSGKAMQDFAYQSKHHKEVVRLTRERNWYKEELFSRFQLLGMEGSWGNSKALSETEQGL